MSYNVNPAFNASADTYTPDNLVICSELQETVTVLSGENRVRGDVLGRKATAGTIVAAAGSGNTGNGTMGSLSVGGAAREGVYKVVIVEPGTNLGTFIVEAPDGRIVGRGVVASAFTGEINFTLADGATDFVSGDYFNVTVSAVTYKYLKAVASATDGSADLRYAVVLLQDTDASRRRRLGARAHARRGEHPRGQLRRGLHQHLQPGPRGAARRGDRPPQLRQGLRGDPMSIGTYDSAFLLGVLDSLENDPITFVRDRYFRQEIVSDQETILFDVIDKKRRLAPFVHPTMKGKIVEARGYSTRSFKPAYVKPKSIIKPLDTIKRLAGEPIAGNLSLAARRDRHIANALLEHEQMISMRRRCMCVEALRLGQVTVTGDGLRRPWW
jgi:hypothetical protein